MRIIKPLLVLIIAFFFFNEAISQKVSPNVIKKPIGFAISKPLKNNPVISKFELQHQEFYMNKHRDRKINPNITPPDFKNMPVDPNEQTEQGKIINSSKALNKNYEGQFSGSYPPDCNGAVGQDYYFQVVNTTYAIYDKSDGSIVAGPSSLNSIFDSSLPGAGENDGDPIILWDEHANRWFYAEFSLGNPTDYMLIAVSTTSDPTGTWYSWSFDVDDTPDYMKFGIWQDGYYMATNTSGGNDVYVFERTKMIAGDPNAQMIGFDNPNRPSTFDGFHCIMPLDNDGDWAPTGTPGQFITIADDGQSNASDALWIYELDVDWTTPSNSSFARTQTIDVNSFSGNFSNDWNNISQPGTSQKLDGVSTVLMYRAQYRNFGGTQKIVCTHTIAETSTESAIRWYQLENTGSSWTIAQQGTYNPDNISRWNASIAMNDLGQIGMGYSVSDGNSTYPGIRYCGQTVGAPAGVMDIAETNIWTGQYSQTSYNRWGDYANISVDPSDGETFWFTSEYKSSSSHGTRIAAFTFGTSSNIAPTANANGPYSAEAGVAISFSSSGSSDSDGTITNYYWDFGDGSTSTLANPTHTYSSAGSYTATLTVTDDGGKTGTDNATVTISAGAASYASLPYSTGFETGFDANWSTKGENSYSRIQITTANSPHSGSYHLTMDVTTNGNYCTNEAWMGLDLSGQSQVDMSFWWTDFSDETNTQDGVYFSDNGGASFVKVLDLNGASYTDGAWRQFNLDVDQLASNNGLTLNGTFVVKFQQYDNYSITTDGMAFDDISVTAGGTTNTDAPTGYCASSGGNSSYEWIDLVQLGTINNTSGNDGGYEDYTSQSTDLVFGTQNTINFSTGFSGSSYTEYWHVFIDYNRDGDFEDAGEEVVTGSSSSDATLSGTFTVPTTASIGYTRMRVTMKWDAAATPCESFSYGEVEDYLVYLTPTTRSNRATSHEAGFEIGFEEGMYTIYPNPSSNFINVRLPDNNNVELTIININGKEVKRVNMSNGKYIDVKELPSGIYIININDGRKISSQRFIKL